MSTLYVRKRVISSVLRGSLCLILFLFGVLLSRGEGPPETTPVAFLGDKVCGSEEPVHLTTYTVLPGDTLSSISRRFNTTVESIACINDLSSPDSIRVDTKLLVMCNASGTVRRVVEGDTLSDIAGQYGLSAGEIAEANKLESTELTPGLLLMLPGIVQAKNLSPSRGTPFRWPVSGSVTSGYGWRVHPISGETHFHEGLDIAADSGTKVKAAASGKVAFAGWVDTYGRLVIIDHGNGYETRYGHLSRYAVSEGESVLAGDTVGYVGSSGQATGAHCHFEVRYRGKVQNPRKHLP